MFNLLLRLNRFGRYALSREETVASNWFGGFLAAALAALLLWPATGAEFLGMAALWFGLMLLPVSIALQAGTQAKRRLLCATGAGLGFLGAVACGIALFSDGSFTLFQVFTLGWVLFPWLANFVYTR